MPDEWDGALLRRAREARGLGKVELADAAGVPKSSIGHWERNFHRPSVDSLVKVRGVLGCPWEALLGHVKPTKEWEAVADVEVTNLLAELMEAGDLPGTGFTGEDVDDILAGQGPK